jgi:hypothetical protein
MGSATIINIVGYGYEIMGSYRFISIYKYYLIKYCRADGYPPDQNSKNHYPSVIRIFKISVSVSVRIYAHGWAGRRAGRVPRFFAHPYFPYIYDSVFKK